jgi:hypothetical protein
MYAHIVVEDTSFDNPSSDDFEDVDPLTLDADDVTELNGALHNVGGGVSTNPSAEISFSEVLLLQTPETTSTEESLQNTLGSDPNVRKRSKSAPGPLLIDLETSSTFVHPMTDELYYELCFPNLFPYGRGGPGDIHNLYDMEHARAMLQRGSIYGECHRIFKHTHPIISRCMHIPCAGRLAASLPQLPAVCQVLAMLLTYVVRTRLAILTKSMRRTYDMAPLR